MTFLDWFCDGHLISAVTQDDASAQCTRLYGHTPETVRRWTAEDEI